MADNFVVVSPAELKFRFELKKNIPVTLTLQNPTSDKVAFKVKTTSPKKYCVRPSHGFVDPNSSKEVQVIMQQQREYPANFADCKDKFLVQCVKAPADAKEVGADLFDASKSKDIRQTKLRVVLVGPPKPPSPVPEGVEEPPSPATTAPFVDAGTSALAGAAGGGVAAAAISDKAAIRRRLDLLEGEGAPAGQVQAAPRTGYSLLQLILVAILAFLVGFRLSGAAGLAAGAAATPAGGEL